MLVLQNLEKTFVQPGGEELTVVRDVTLSLETNRRYAVEGPSGSGKSTLLALMAGFERPTRGTVCFGENCLNNLTEAQLSRFRAKNLGFVFQQFHLLSHFNALQNVMVAAEIAGVPQPRVAALDALEVVGLGDRLTHTPQQLSGGEQQRVAIARALVVRPHLILCDEPTGNLDPETSERIVSLLLSVQERLQATLVVVTHDRDIANRMDHCVRIRRGSLVKEDACGS